MNLSALLKHPRVFYFVFIIEILERFSYYGVSSMIGLYAVQSLGLSQEEMAVIFDAFLILLFLPIFIGGYLSDQFIGEKRSILLGLVLLAAGYCSLAFTSAHFFFLSLSLILVGNMFYKTTPASLLAKSVLKEKKTMDSIFTLYYMAINVGSFIGMASFQIMFAHSNLKIAFLTGFAGVILAFLVSLGFYQFIQCKAVKPLSSKNLYGIFVLIIAAIALFNYSLQLPWLLHCVEVVLFVAVIMLFPQVILLMPLYAALVGGDLVAKETEDGTLRMILSRPISHSVRLFANMLAGHITLKVFASFITLLGGMGIVGIAGAVLPLSLVVALTALELLVAFLQAYVFAILTCIYLNDAIHPGH